MYQQMMSPFENYIDIRIKSSEKIKDDIRNYVRRYCIIDSQTLIINHNSLIGLCDDSSYPNDIPKTYEEYPISEWTHTIDHRTHIIQIIFGLDWLGIHHCGDKYCRYLIINEKEIAI